MCNKCRCFIFYLKLSDPIINVIMELHEVILECLLFTTENRVTKQELLNNWYHGITFCL